MTYIVHKSESLYELEAKVNTSLSREFQLVGGIACVFDFTDGFLGKIFYCQAMVRTKPREGV